MYTESFAGDVDELLRRQAIKTPIRQRGTCSISPDKGHRDQFGFTANQRREIAEWLKAYWIECEVFGALTSLVLEIGPGSRIVVHNPKQAACLFVTLTHCDWRPWLHAGYMTSYPKWIHDIQRRDLLARRAKANH